MNPSSSPEPKSLLFELFVANQRVRSLLAAALQDAPLRADEYAVYSVVRGSPGMTLTEVARRTSLPLTTAAEYVRTMTDRGHIKKVRHPEDGRAHGLYLQAGGIDAHNRTGRAFDRASAALRDSLPLTEQRASDVIKQLGAAAAKAQENFPPRFSSRVGA